MQNQSDLYNRRGCKVWLFLVVFFKRHYYISITSIIISFIKRDEISTETHFISLP